MEGKFLNSEDNIAKQRTEKENESYVSDRELRQYEKFFGVNFSEMQGKTLLDIGSGRNELFSKQVAQKGVKVVSIATHLKDGISPNFKNKFYKNWQGLSVAGRVQEMPFNDETFDYEFSLFAFPHWLAEDVREYKKGLNEIIRTLKPGGKAYLCPISVEKYKLIAKVLADVTSVTYLKEHYNLGLGNNKRYYRLILTKKNL